MCRGRLQRAFTLIELLVVMAIMGLLGTISVGGYRAMQRGMEQRGVLLNVRQFVLAAQERARIDRVPVNVYFWNETLREETDTEPPVIVGKAAAVRRTGRVTQVGDNYLYDEFGDLRAMADEADASGNVNVSTGSKQGLFLYRIGKSTNFERSLIAPDTEANKDFVVYVDARLPDDPDDADFKRAEIFKSAKIQPYGFRVIEKNGVSWKTGDAYGFAFEEIQLPKNFIFGSTSSPVTEIKVFNYEFDPLEDAWDKEFSDDKVDINLRPAPNGGMKAVKIGDSNASVD
ncbi:MAG TPA: hypothetical protein DDY72_06690 [Verrucomicrobia bacterium]|nr:hypothetical protein [Verrucomicrobiota bacterium]